MVGFDCELNGALYDYIGNLILFIPLGFSMFGCLIHKNNKHFIRSVLIVIVACSSLSMSIEIIQKLLPSRFSTFSDWILNTISGSLGILFFVLFGKSAIQTLTRIVLWPTRITVHLGIKLLILLLYLPTTLFISALIKPDSSFDNWNTQYHLMFGNEFNGARHWYGQIHCVDIYNRVFLNQNITEKPTFSLNEKDLAHQCKIFEWMGDDNSRVFSNSDTEIITTKGKWLCSTMPIASIIEQIQSTGRLYLKIDFTSHSANQTGPARIISISKNPLERNFTVGQDDSSLIIRMRTPFTGNNGSDPELVIPNVVKPNQRITLEVIFDGTCLYAVINGKHSPRRLDFNSGMNLAFKLFYANAPSSPGWGIIYSATLCAILGVIIRLIMLEIENPVTKKIFLVFVPLGYSALVVLPSLTLVTPKSDALEHYFACIFTIYFVLWFFKRPAIPYS